MDKQDNKPILQYFQPEYGHFILCTWKIKGISWKMIEEIRDWTDNKVQVKGPRIWIKRINKNEYPSIYELNIRGRGPDDRCTWCKTYRTALNTKCEKEFNCPILYKNGCEFD